MIFKDQLNRVVRLQKYPERIVSLVPSITELLFDLDLSEEIIGVTDYCIKPESKILQKKKIGGTKNFDFITIDELRPDLIIGNKEENYKEGIMRLRKKYPVWISDVNSIEDALNMILEIGKMVNRQDESRRLAEKIKTDLLVNAGCYPKIKTAYIIWKEPYMAAGGKTFINAMMDTCGFVNIFEKLERYPCINLEDMKEADLILLSTEPFHFKQKDVVDIQKILCEKSVKLIDGTIFSWYGSRMQYAAAYIKNFRVKLESTIQH